MKSTPPPKHKKFAGRGIKFSPKRGGPSSSSRRERSNPLADSPSAPEADPISTAQETTEQKRAAPPVSPPPQRAAAEGLLRLTLM